MGKYVAFIFIALLGYLIFAELYPIYKNVNSCIDTFTESYIRIGLLDNPPSGEAGEKFCKEQKRKLLNFESCLDASKEKESIKGLTNSFLRINLLFRTDVNSLRYEKERYNSVCGSYKRLKFKDIYSN